MLAYERLIITVQRRTRGLTQRIKWLKRKDRLRAGVRLAQRLYRGLRGRRFAAALSAEKFSDWEQLWNDKRQLMYYYNKITKESTYREPRGPFRPLLRDKKSYALVQAWPDLEGGLSEVESPTEKYLLPALYDQTGLSQTGYEMTSFEQQQETYPVIEGAGTYDPNNSLAESTWGGESEYDTQADFVPDPAFASTDTGTTGQLVNAEPPVNPMMCSVCKVRKYMRICFDCTGIGVNHRWAPSYTNGAYSSKFCFSCFALTHPSGDPDTKGHRTEESTLAAAVAAMAASQEDNFGETEGIALGQESKSLMCSVCSEPATRKCMGPLDDRHIDALCNEIHKASATSWVSILQSTGLWSDRRLSVLLEQVKGIDVGGNNVGASGRLSLAQLQEVRIMLERTRAECDDCYCASCYAEVHTGGKRSSHKWVGFQQHAAVCAVCSHSAAEVTCKDCATNYCNSCFRVFHSKGRKKKHSKEILLEDASNHYASRCVVCVRRLGALKCRDCDELCCDSCLECGAHKAVCVPNPIAGDISRPDTATSAYSAGRSLANAASSDWGVSDGGRGTKQVNCVVCGEPADQKCVQCRDHYCSRVWMGNPGCFAVQHSKGNRAKHVVQSLDNIDEGSPPASPNARRTIGNTMNMSQLPPLSPGSKQMSSTRKTKGEGRLK